VAGGMAGGDTTGGGVTGTGVLGGVEVVGGGVVAPGGVTVGVSPPGGMAAGGVGVVDGEEGDEPPGRLPVWVPAARPPLSYPHAARGAARTSSNHAQEFPSGRFIKPP